MLRTSKLTGNITEQLLDGTAMPCHQKEGPGSVFKGVQQVSSRRSWSMRSWKQGLTRFPTSSKHMLRFPETSPALRKPPTPMPHEPRNLRHGFPACVQQNECLQPRALPAPPNTSMPVQEGLIREAWGRLHAQLPSLLLLLRVRSNTSRSLGRSPSPARNGPGLGSPPGVRGVWQKILRGQSGTGRWEFTSPRPLCTHRKWCCGGSFWREKVLSFPHQLFEAIVISVQASWGLFLGFGPEYLRHDLLRPQRISSPSRFNRKRSSLCLSLSLSLAQQTDREREDGKTDRTSGTGHHGLAAWQLLCSVYRPKGRQIRPFSPD